MAQFDLPLEELRTYCPDVHEPSDLDAFWRDTLALDEPVSAIEEPLDNRQQLVDSHDVTFTGFGGAPIKAWLHVPAGADGPLPAVVRFHGFSVSRGMPTEHPYATAGYAEFVMDNRGQGWADNTIFDRSPDPDLSAGAFGPEGPMTKGIQDPETFYFRRLVTDAARLLQYAAGHRMVDPSHLFVAGASQGGYLTLAAAGLAPSLGIELAGALPDVPFLCHPRRAVALTDERPFSRVAEFIRTAPHLEENVWHTLGYFDGVHFARRATAPALFSVGLFDQVCPPSTVFAAHNAYAGDKGIEVYPCSGHEGGGAVQGWKQLGWLAERR